MPLSARHCAFRARILETRSCSKLNQISLYVSRCDAWQMALARSNVPRLRQVAIWMSTVSPDLKMRFAGSGIRPLFLPAALASLWGLLRTFGDSALTWPAIDNYPALCRMLQPQCLPSDFLAEASGEVNPRSPHVAILYFFSRLRGGDPDQGFALAQSVVPIVLPALMVVTLSLLIINLCLNSERKPTLWLLDSPHRIRAVGLLVLAMYILILDIGGRYLAIAWWQPVTYLATPQNFSLILGLTATVLLLKVRLLSSVTLWFAAGVIHPPIALMLFTVVYTLGARQFWSQSARVILLTGGLPTVLAALASSILLSSPAKLSSSEFVDIYIFEAHPWHYAPQFYGSLSSFTQDSVILVILVTLASITSLAAWLRTAIWRNALLGLGLVLLALFSQHLVANVLPIKPLASLGPSRFTMFAPWIIVVLLAALLILTLGRLAREADVSGDNERMYRKRSNLVRNLSIFITAIVCVLLPLHFSLSKVRPVLQPDEETILAAIERVTDANDVVAAPWPSLLRFYIPISTGRGIFVDNGFPFTEDAFREWRIRFNELYGTSNSEQLSPHSSHYGQLTPEDLLQISNNFRLDWIVTESPGNPSFDGCEAIVQTESLLLFSVGDLNKCRRN